MTFDERIGWFLLGCFVGAVLGYIARSLKDIEDKLEEVDEAVHNGQSEKTRNEHGLIRHPIVLDIVLLLVVLMTAWAAFSSQRASNELEDTQDRLAKVAFCNQQYLTAQAKFLAIYVQEPPPTEAEKAREFKQYLEALDRFIEAGGVTSISPGDTSRLPEEAGLDECLAIMEERSKKNE